MKMTTLPQLDTSMLSHDDHSNPSPHHSVATGQKLRQNARSGWWARLEAPAYALLRVAAGAMFAVHGLQKVFGVLGAKSQPAVWSQLWVGGVIELVCGALIAVGLFTRGAAFLASGTMAVAYLQFHWKFQLAGGLWVPTLNQGELALLYAFVFLFVLARGAGVASVDGWLARRVEARLTRSEANASRV